MYVCMYRAFDIAPLVSNVPYFRSAGMYNAQGWNHDIRHTCACVDKLMLSQIQLFYNLLSLASDVINTILVLNVNKCRCL